jgi:hypothetical protein
MRSASLEPVWPEGGDIGRKFSRKATSGGIIKEKVTPLMLFYGKIIATFVFMLETRLFRKYAHYIRKN